MHLAISINTLCLKPAPLGDLLDTVARIGARGISPDLEQVKEAGARKSATFFRDAGLEVATLTHRSFDFATPERTAAGRERLKDTIAIAAEIGAQSIIMTTGGRGTLCWAEAAERFAEAMAPCAEAARSAGIPLGIEPTSHLYSDVSIAHRLADTVALARKAGIGVMIDIFACWFDSDIESAIADAGATSPLIQVSDYVYGDRALPCRAVPGDGAVPFDRLVSAIARSGFDGWFDLEIIGPRLQAEGQEAGLRRAAENMGDLLASAGFPTA
jgi:sugar phosphate isomerase/epimerase